MSNSKMLIDATHPEETRVVVQRNGRVEEFDFESAARKLLRGNIYLAKVTRVEPSLQAAFVDYGGNRHGFLAFNEIHPDYYQIPVADRLALIEEEAAAEAELEAAADRRAEALARRSQGRDGGQRGEQSEPSNQAGFDDDAAGAEDAEPGEGSNIIDVEEDEHIEEIGGDGSDDDAPKAYTSAAAVENREEQVSEPAPAREHEVADHHEAGADSSNGAVDSEDHDHDDHDHHGQDDHGHDDQDHGGDHGDAVAEASDDQPGEAHAGDTGGEPQSRGRSGRRGRGDEEMPLRPRRRPRSYKIQEVIKRRQIILVQVVKEERGNKGAALTTYLSLAGRYTVLMPNTARGGGISRKITNPQDRKRLKAIAQELEVPEGMGLIIRTAGAARTKQEIKRDFEYLLRLWENVRDLTLQSTAPSLVYEEGDLIKRSIRDLYNKDVEEVVVAGDTGFQEASAFMQMLLPSHSKNVISYKDATPLFARYGVERQLNAMFSPQVTLRSGGYIVINQTEALVAIDVNSGKSTREFSIEETALATNLEAADEIARQLKLRDLAGLIVIDFIDMEEKRNNRAVERRLKDALRHDRARIQLGRISHFGLMEMSRQRLRTGVLEGSTSQCAHCQGTGTIRSTESIALAVLRGIEDTITAGSNAPLIATATPTVALYILNSKRAYVTDMEARHGYPITILGAERIQGANFTIERGAAAALPQRRPERAAVNMDWGFEGEGDEQAPEAEGSSNIEEIADDSFSGGDGEAREPRHRDREGGEDDGSRRGGRGRRRRRRGGGGRRDGRGDEGPRTEFNAERPQHLNDAGEDGDAEDTGMDAPEGDDIVEAAGANGATRFNGDRDEGGDKRGRRRRRGRRGGRRGRGDRDGSERPAENFSNDGAGNSDGDSPTHTAPGFEPQPDIGETGGMDSERNGAEPGARRGRNRPERIWDVPAEPREVRETREPREPRQPRETSPETIPPREAARAEPSVDTPVADVAVAAAPRRPRHELDSSEPRIERVVVKPGEEGGATAENAPAPQRKGWWQRRFGAE